MTDLFDLLLGVFKCNHMYYIKEFFSIHFFVQVCFFLSLVVLCSELLIAGSGHRQHETKKI